MEQDPLETDASDVVSAPVEEAEQTGIVVVAGVDSSAMDGGLPLITLPKQQTALSIPTQKRICLPKRKIWKTD
jgi:hypothetical protein